MVKVVKVEQSVTLRITCDCGWSSPWTITEKNLIITKGTFMSCPQCGKQFIIDIPTGTTIEQKTILDPPDP